MEFGGDGWIDVMDLVVMDLVVMDLVVMDGLM